MLMEVRVQVCCLGVDELGRECFCVYHQLNVNVLGPSILKGCYMNIISKMPTMWSLNFQVRIRVIYSIRHD